LALQSDLQSALQDAHIPLAQYVKACRTAAQQAVLNSSRQRPAGPGLPMGGHSPLCKQSLKRPLGDVLQVISFPVLSCTMHTLLSILSCVITLAVRGPFGSLLLLVRGMDAVTATSVPSRL
jgi:hypothetical protein